MCKSKWSVILLGGCSFAFSAFAFTPVVVKDVTESVWTTHVETHNEGASHGARAGVGAAAGWWLLGPLGAIGGAVLGGHSGEEAQTTIKDTEVHGFQVQLSNGQTVRTRRLYRVGEEFDFRSAE